MTMNISKYVYLFWWHRGTLNMGDEASSYIVRHLTGQNIKRKDIPTTFGTALRKVFGEVLHFRKPKLKPILSTLFDREKYVVGLGSVITCSNKNALIWGSGFQRPTDRFIDKMGGGNFLAVRGLYTVNELRKRGLPTVSVIGDPGLLMPLILQQKIEKRYDIGIIPHIREYESVKHFVGDSDIHVIDFRTDDVESCIMEILSCRRIISSSLHGLIFSHAYAIPALFFQYEHKGEGSFKYKDYFSSVGIDYYTPYQLEKLISLSREELIKFIDSKIDANSINVDLLELQKKLISVAPFELKNQYNTQNIEKTLLHERVYLDEIKKL